MRFLVILLLFGFAVAASAFLAKTGLRGNVETELEVRSLAALSGAGYGGVKVQFDHLDGSLAGTVDHPDEIPKVIEVLRRDVPTAYWPEAGATGITIRPTIAPRLRVTRAEGSDEVRLEGVLAIPEDAGRGMLGSRLHALAGIGKVDNGITLDAMVLPFPKMAELSSLASGLLAHEGAVEVKLGEGTLKLVGTVPNDGLKAGLLDLAALVGVANVVDEIRVKMPDSFTRVSELRITRNRFGVTLSGVYPSAEEKAALLALFAGGAPGAGLPVVDRLDLSDTCGPAAWQQELTEVVPAILSGLKGEMTAEFTATQIRVNGTTADAATRQGLIDQLTLFEKGVPAFELVAEITLEGSSGTASPVELSAIYEGDLLVLRGRLPGADVVAEIESKLKAILPKVSVKNEVEVIPSANGDEWTARLVEFFEEVLPRVTTAKMVFKEGTLDLEGRTIALADRQIVQNLAVNTVPATFKIHNRLLHADQPFPKPALLPGERTQLAETLKTFPLYFDKNSEVLKDEAKTKVGTLVEAVKAAGGEVELVVTGYADNVGNADHNKELSLRRAESVRLELVRLGIAADTLSVTSTGEDVSRVSRSELWKSRRVEVSLKPTSPPARP